MPNRGLGGSTTNDLRLGGAYGKARRVRTRKRAARLHAQRLIAELDGDDPEELFARRDIPLGHRNDFIPAVVFTTARDEGDSQWHGIGTQLQLPLSIHDLPEESNGIGEADRTPTPTTDMDPDVIRIGRTDRAPLFKRPEQMRKPRAVTVGGFLLGCALGTAAAALALLVLRATFG